MIVNIIHDYTEKTPQILSRRWVIITLIGALILMTGLRVSAEGSGDLTDPANGGDRPYTEWVTQACPQGCAGDIQRQTLLSVYVNAGEQVHLGSSTHTSFTDPIDIVVRSPLGGQDLTCDVINLGFGHVENRAEELAGPLPNVGGYDSCNFIAAETGIYEVEFHAPLAVTTSGNPPPIGINGNFPTDATTIHGVAAWDITVFQTPNNAASTVIGRVFTNALALNMGSNNRFLFSHLTVLTNDGYQYEVGLNGIDPFGFNFFSNTKGLQDAAGNPLFRSVQLEGANPGVLPAGVSIHNPLGPDNAATGDFTHKIFINTPDPNLPLSAMSPSGMTWLLSPPIAPPTPQNFSFTGSEGTVGQMGTNPLGGAFTFDILPVVANVGTFRITLDINNDAIFGNANDRLLTGAAAIGSNSAPWDGLDGLGAPVPASTIPYGAQVVIFGGEVHFPFIDPEQHPNGMIIERTVDPGTTLGAPNPFTIYYNDTYNYTGAGPYDSSVCAAGETPAPPIALPSPACYGTPSTPRNGVTGVLSTTGAHAHNNTFGNQRVIETWTNYPSEAFNLLGGVRLIEADLRINKTANGSPIARGGSVTYTIVVDNLGPSNVTGATVRDTFDPNLTNITWTCIATGAATCSPAGAGSINDTVNIAAGAGNFLTYTVSAQVALGAPATINNTANVDRPPDVNDPNLANNQSTASINIVDGPGMAITKDDGRTVVSANGEQTTYVLAYNNNGTGDAANVSITDNLPAGASFVSCNPACVGTGPVQWAIGVVPAGTGGNVSLTVNLAAVTPPANHVNTATLSFTDTGGVPFPDASAQDIDTVSGTPPTGGSGGGQQPPPSSGGSTAPFGDGVISLSVTPNSPFVKPGDPLTWTITITNTSTSPANNISINNLIPPGLQIIGTSANVGFITINGQIVLFTLPTLGPGQTVTFTVSTLVSDDPNTLIFNYLATLSGPVDLTAFATALIAASLPQTGETPLWASLLHIGFSAATTLGFGGLIISAAHHNLRQRL